MTNWRLRIEGVPEIIDLPVDTSTKALILSGYIRESVRQAKIKRVLTNRDTIDLTSILDGLSTVKTEDDFNGVMSVLYDWADDYAVWIEFREQDRA